MTSSNAAANRRADLFGAIAISLSSITVVASLVGGLVTGAW